MRCPKCGYNSFDHLDSCKKCGKDLVEFKQRYGIRSVLFPGEMKRPGLESEAAFDVETADAAVTAATAAAGATASAAVSEPVADAAVSDSDDFGFDFMGDSTEEDDLSFDELFEEAPEDEDVEESIEGPSGQAKEDQGEEFSFDLPEDDSELENDFGFDPGETLDEGAEDDDFSFNDDESEGQGDKSKGSGEDPQNPFDFPESSLLEGAPEEEQTLFDLSGDPEQDAEPLPVAALAATPSAVNEAEAMEGGGSPVEENDHLEPFLGKQDAAGPPVFHRQAAVETPSVASRIMAFCCDLSLLSIVGICFVIAAEAAMSPQSTRLIPSLETLIDLSVPYFLVLFSLAFGYFSLFHFLAGQTPGKMLTGLRVETVEGEALSFGQAFLRSVGGLLQLLPIGLGYLVILLHPERRGWNDRLAGTRVVALNRFADEA